MSTFNSASDDGGVGGVLRRDDSQVGVHCEADAAMI
jgi:hypothetical protein